jgi:WS/DGAT/MGAT family acyltransferase
MHRLTHADALFLYNETPAQHLHTLKIAIIDPSGNPDGYSFKHEKEKLASRLHRVPPFRWRVVPTPFSLHHPLVVESDVDLDLHLHRATVSSPGGPRELAELISEIASRPLDRDRPLWELWMVEGLAGGRVACVGKIHHTLADGVASAELLNEFLTHEPGDELAHDAPPWLPEAVPSRGRLVAMGVRDLARFLPHAVRELAHAVRESRRREAETAARHGEPPPTPGSGPLTSLNRVLSAQRRFAFTELPLSQAKLVRKAFGTTLNDVVVAVVAAALRRYLERRGEVPSVPLVAVVPVSLHTPEDKGRYGNHSSPMYVALHSEIADAVERLRATQSATGAAKQHLQDTKGAQEPDWLEVFPPFVSKLVFRRLPTWMMKRGRPPRGNVIISNVPGASEPLYYGRSKVTGFFSMGPLLEGIGLNVTVWSYGDQLAWSFLACRNAVDDIWELVDGVRTSFEELTQAAGARTAA